MKDKLVWLIVFLVFVQLFSFLIIFLLSRDSSTTQVNSFEECAAAGYPVMESYPRQCRTPDGRLFVETITPTIIPPDRQVILNGTTTCLPKISDGAQTDECAVGIQTATGDYYGLRGIDQNQNGYQPGTTGVNVRVIGTLIYEEIFGPDGNRYDTVAVIEVSSITIINPNKHKRDLIETQYPELKDFENQNSFAGTSVESVTKKNTTYFAYITYGSGIPIVSASCFSVDDNLNVKKVGNFPDPADSYIGYSSVDPISCKGQK